MYKIGFIGAGNMGGALITAACKSTGADQVVITDYDPAKAKELAEKLGCVAVDNNDDLVRQAEYIVFAVKPNVIRSVAGGIADTLKACLKEGQKKTVVTIAAGIAVSVIKGCIDCDVPVIRIMPNTPAMVGQGMILLTCDQNAPDEISEEQFAEFQSLIAAAGEFERIPEAMMDLTTGVSSCAPAFVYMFIEALADGAVQVGVPRAQAMRLAAKTVLGSAAMVLETGEHPGALKDAVCSPGGSTIVGVTTLEQYGFRNAAAQAIIKSTERNLELGK